MQRKPFWQHDLFQSLAGFRIILKSGRVVERNPITMECDRYCISTMTSEARQGKRPRENVPCGSNQSVKIKL